MKIYYLVFNKDNLDLDDGIWRSNLIDLYDNEHYRNYSTTKSIYGTNALGDKTWTGLTDTNPSDAGLVEDGRFIDCSGQIGIEQFSLHYEENSPYKDAQARISVYTTDDETAFFPDEFSSLIDQFTDTPLNHPNADRYARFEFTINTDHDINDVDFECVVIVSIDTPPMAPLYAATQRALRRFPEWMALRKDSETQATPSLAQPETLAGHVVNAIAGEYLDHLSSQLSVQSIESHIDTLDPLMPNRTYQVYSLPEYFESIQNEDGEEFARAASLFELYDDYTNPLLCYVDRDSDSIVTFGPHDIIRIDGINYETTYSPLWNMFDEFGLLVDLVRLKDEENDRFRLRILDVYRNKPGVTLEALKRTLRRELDLWQAFDVPISLSTPSDTSTPVDLGPEYTAATPEILDMGHMENDPVFWHADGMPTDRFVKLIESLVKEYPTTWGFFVWDQAFWDVAQDDTIINYDVLPYRLDAAPSNDMQYGVGDGQDLLIAKPTNNVNSDSLDLTFTARGVRHIPKTSYPEIDINLDVYGQANRINYENPPITVPFVLRLQVIKLELEYWYVNFEITATSDIDWNNPVPSIESHVGFELFSEFSRFGIPGATVHTQGGDTFVWEDDPFVYSLNAADIRPGAWDPNTNDVVDIPTVDNWFAYHSLDPGVSVNKDSSWTPLSLVPGDDGVLLLKPGAWTLASLESSSSLGKWQSPSTPINATINGVAPNETTQSFVTDSPTILWPLELESPAEHEVVLQLRDTDDEGNYGVLTTDVNDERLFLPSSYLYVNGSNSWNSDGQMILDWGALPDTLTFTSGSDTLYPIDDSYLESFSESFTVGVDDLASFLEYSSLDFYKHRSDSDTLFLGNFVIAKTDFGLPNDSEYIITWVGVTTNNDQVNCWLDSNIVEPIITLYDNTQYPNNSIVEELDSGNYLLKNVVAFARVKPGPNKYWDPQMHVGWFYDDEKEYYVYHKSETATLNSGDEVALTRLPQQGAPIIIKTDEATPVEYRQVAFHNATPELTMINTETKIGNTRDQIFLGYHDVYDVTVTDSYLGEVVVSGASSATNMIQLPVETVLGREYLVTYRVRNSFYIDNDRRDSDYNSRPLIVFDSAISNPVTITYETSPYATATPIDVHLHPFYTSTEESFIFISKNEYDPYSAEVKLSPQVIIGDGEDYLLVTIKCYDTWGNPKVGYEYTLGTDFGTLSAPSVITNEDGYAYAFLYSEVSSVMQGTVTINGNTPNDLLDGSVDFRVHPPESVKHRVVALANHEFVPADGLNNVVVFGVVQDPDLTPVANAIVRYRTGKTIHEALIKPDPDIVIGPDRQLLSSYTSWPDTGKTVADSRGRFSIGPFTSQDENEPGHLFVVIESKAIESDLATPTGNDSSPDWEVVGDVVMWYEYPDILHGIENLNQLPIQSSYVADEDQATPESIPNRYPVAYSEYITAQATPGQDTTVYPKWFAIDKYTQYQMGLLGSVEQATVSTYYDDNHHPDHKDI